MPLNIKLTLIISLFIISISNSQFCSNGSFQGLEINHTITSLSIFRNNLIVAGTFGNAGGIPNTLLSSKK